MPKPPRTEETGSDFIAPEPHGKKSSSPGTKGYAEQQPRRNDKREMPDKHTPHEHQNKPEQEPRPSHH